MDYVIESLVFFGFFSAENSLHRAGSEVSVHVYKYGSYYCTCTCIVGILPYMYMHRHMHVHVDIHVYNRILPRLILVVVIYQGAKQ